MIAVAALLTVAAACLTAAAAQRFRDAGQQINAALADPPSYDPDAEACALTRPDDDQAYLNAVAADLIRSRAVRRLARRLETTR